MTYNEFYNNEAGAVFCATAGEINPWLTLGWSRIEHNGRKLYGNFTTSKAALNLDLQNMQDVYIKVYKCIFNYIIERRNTCFLPFVLIDVQFMYLFSVKLFWIL